MGPRSSPEIFWKCICDAPFFADRVLAFGVGDSAEAKHVSPSCPMPNRTYFAGGAMSCQIAAQAPRQPVFKPTPGKKHGPLVDFKHSKRIGLIGVKTYRDVLMYNKGVTAHNKCGTCKRNVPTAFHINLIELTWTQLTWANGLRQGRVASC
jgi:hypothetical protein